MPWLPQDAIQLGTILVGNGNTFARKVEVRQSLLIQRDSTLMCLTQFIRLVDEEKLPEVISYGTMEEVLPCREIAAAGFGLFA